LEQDIYDHLRDPDSGDTSNADRQDARLRFRHLVGPAIYLGRIPEGVQPVAAFLRRVTSGEAYHVAGEDDTAQPVIEFVVVARGRNRDAVETASRGRDALEAAEQLRLIFSGYSGLIGEAWCSSATVERGAMQIPSAAVDGSDDWVYAYSLDFRFTVDQVVV
jgi:hypothetical protein